LKFSWAHIFLGHPVSQVFSAYFDSIPITLTLQRFRKIWSREYGHLNVLPPAPKWLGSMKIETYRFTNLLLHWHR